ncbi:hybrid signal transduction histidine kinase G [Geobacter sp. OR-1]|uniref:response regulator n=1 Tax=Geobacter sp. OR-1 TaxID=1266765 RepID=UPI000542B6D4|nr:response regulator [Geobacter sp. OR-1]GAM09778.1 hybrid signal transduction histidine kinase G [Geobacter sp. OR-1]
MKALIVDDCQLTREMLGFAIQAEAEIDYAVNGEEAITLVSQAIAKGAYYDLICLDITMPVMGGLEALRKIRDLEGAGKGGRATIFMITASSSPDDMIEAISEGECDDYLTKPVIGKTFKDLLRKYNLPS